MRDSYDAVNIPDAPEIHWYHERTVNARGGQLHLQVVHAMNLGLTFAWKGADRRPPHGQFSYPSTKIP